MNTWDEITMPFKRLKVRKYRHFQERSHCYLEEEARNTIENYLNCQEILSQYNNDTHIHIVSNDFHIPRAYILGRHILGSRFPRIYPCPAPTVIGIPLHLQKYRNTKERPIDVNDWYACERIDWELNGILELNQKLAEYGLPKIPEPDITSAWKELRQKQSEHINK